MIFVMVTITSIIMTMLFAAYIYQQVGTSLSSADIANNVSMTAYNQFDVAFYIFDKAGMFILIAMIIGLIISALYIPSSPIFLVINIIGFIFMVFLGAVFSNMHYNVIETANMTNISNTYYPTTTYIMNQLPWIGAFIIFILTIIMYGKSKDGGYG